VAHTWGHQRLHTIALGSDKKRLDRGVDSRNIPEPMFVGRSALAGGIVALLLASAAAEFNFGAVTNQDYLQYGDVSPWSPSYPT